ncbi:MAG: sigma-70 family RNA polymerase sigma factor [archaeon]
MPRRKRAPREASLAMRAQFSKEYLEPSLPKLEAFFLRCFPKNHQLAKDLVQDTCLTFLERLPNVENRDRAEAYLFTCARNLVKNTRYYIRRNRALENFFAIKLMRRHNPDPLEIVSGNFPEQRKRIAGLFKNAKLTPEEERVTAYKYGFEDGEAKTIKETAAHFEKTPDAIGLTLSRSYAKLRKAFNADPIYGELGLEKGRNFSGGFRLMLMKEIASGKRMIDVSRSHNINRRTVDNWWQAYKKNPDAKIFRKPEIE